MIENFLSKMAEDLYHGVNSKHSRKLSTHLHQKAKRLLDQLNNATKLSTLRVPSCNKLVKLTGNLSEFWQIKINEQWAIIFKWDPDHSKALEVHLI